MNFNYLIKSYDRATNRLEVVYQTQLGEETITISLPSYNLSTDSITEIIQYNAPYVKLVNTEQLAIEQLVNTTGEAVFKATPGKTVIRGVSRPVTTYEKIDVVQNGVTVDGSPIFEHVISQMTAEEIAQKKIDITNNKISAIKNKRDAIKVGGVKVGTKWFHTDADSRIQFLGLIGMGSNIAAGLKWKTMDGSFIDMTPLLAQQVFASTAQLDITVFAVAETHIAAIKQSTTPDTYDFQGQWPLTFSESS